MAKNNYEQTEENLANIEGAISKTEQFVEGNKKNLSYGVLAIFAVVLMVLGYNKYVQVPNETEAYNTIWHAEQYFNQDSLEWALNGHDENPGFLDIIDEYGSTKSGNLAYYYAGISYFRMAQKAEGAEASSLYEEAIDLLKDFSSEDLNVKPMAIGAIGDCEMELGNQDEAVSYYIQAARLVDNELTTPLFLKKAGMTYSMLGNHEDALKLFKEIKTKYFKSDEAREIKKYIAREEQYIGK